MNWKASVCVLCNMKFQTAVSIVTLPSHHLNWVFEVLLHKDEKFYRQNILAERALGCNKNKNSFGMASTALNIFRWLCYFLLSTALLLQTRIWNQKLKLLVQDHTASHWQNQDVWKQVLSAWPCLSRHSQPSSATYELSVRAHLLWAGHRLKWGWGLDRLSHLMGPLGSSNSRYQLAWH